jgi:hypothetical protein
VLNATEGRTELKNIKPFESSGHFNQEDNHVVTGAEEDFDETTRNLFKSNKIRNEDLVGARKSTDGDEEIVKVIHGMFRETNELSETNEDTNKIFNVTVLMRRTCVDFYYNFKYLSTLYNEADDIELTFEDLYLKLKAPDFNKLK